MMGWLKDKNRQASKDLAEATTGLAATLYVTDRMQSLTERMKADSDRMKAERLAKKAAKKAEKLSKKGLTS